MLAKTVDTSLRYSVDKTSREILFMPLPSELKYRAKPFIDVTVDRVAKSATSNRPRCGWMSRTCRRWRRWSGRAPNR